MAKRWSDRACPATCELCGGLSHVLASTSSGIGVGWVLILIASMVMAAGMQSYLVAAAGACASILFNIWAWRRAELVPIPRESVSAARAVHWLLAGFYALCALFN